MQELFCCGYCCVVFLVACLLTYKLALEGPSVIDFTHSAGRQSSVTLSVVAINVIKCATRSHHAMCCCYFENTVSTVCHKPCMCYNV